MLKNKKSAVSFGTIIGIFGSVLIALGVAWLIAQNWHQIPAPLKILILLTATSGAYVAGTIFRTKNYAGIGQALLVLGSLLYTLSIFLIAQIFSTSTSWQGTSWLLLLAWAGVLAASYIFDSSMSLIVAMIEFNIWLVFQFIAFMEASNDASPGILAFYFLATAVLLYGLNLLHKSRNHKFSKVYQLWTAIYFLSFTYILSFQVLLPLMWPKETTNPSMSIVFLFFLSIAALVSLITGIMKSISNRAVENREITGFIALVALLAVLIGLTSFVSDQRSYFWFFGGGGEVSTALWLIWIFANIVFLLAILAIIGYGTWQRLPHLINVGIVFFSLDIITRYIGFVMDLWGYTSLSIIFITGGIVLFVGGWLVEKWRRKLVSQAKITGTPKQPKKKR